MLSIQKGVWLLALCLVTTVAWPVLAAEEGKKSGDAPAAEKSDVEVDPFVVPDGAPKELMEYIKKLVSTPIKSADAMAKTRESILKAAEKILAAKPSDEEMEFAVQAKMNMLKDPEKLAAFAEELKKAGREKFARQVRGFAMQLELRGSSVASPEKLKVLVNKVVKFLKEAPPQPSEVMLAFTAGRLAEATDDNQFATDAYSSFAKIFTASDNAKLKELAQMFEGVVRRLNLLGNEITIEGVLLGGEKFDWSKYAGKVVLVDFWATWCGPCVGEIPSMKKCYELYHDKGFDIVGLSCDRNLADLEKFVKEKEIPWAIVYGDGKPSPTVSYYGIMGIPTMILVGKDGKVVSLSARGEDLKKELEKLLGPVEEKKDAEGEKKEEQDEKAGDGKEE